MPVPLHILCVLCTGTLLCFLVVMRAFAADKYPMPQRVRQQQPTTPAFQLFLPNALISLTEDNSTFFPARPAAFGPELPPDGLSAILWIGAGFGEDGVEPQGELGCSDVPGWDSHRTADGLSFLPEISDPDDGTDNYLEDVFTGAYFRSAYRSSSSRTKSKAVVPAIAAADHAGDAHADDDAAAADDDDAASAPQNSADDAAPAAPAAAAADPRTRTMVAVPAATNTAAAAGGRTKSEASPHSDIQSLQEGAEIAGKIVLLRRGGCGFLAKVMWAQRRGAVGVIVGDDRKGGPLIQMYASGDTSDVLIPSVFTAHTTAHLLTALVAAAVRDEDNKNKAAAAAAAASAAAAAAVREAEKMMTTTTTTTTSTTGTADRWFGRAQPREWVLDEYVPTSTSTPLQARATAPTSPDNGRALYVTISPARGGFTVLDTILFIIASPFIAIMTITAVLIFLRAQCNYRAWRAPKAIVAQLPVHIFVPPGQAAADATTAAPTNGNGNGNGSPRGSPPSTPPRSPSPSAAQGSTEATPLLQRPRSRTTTGVPGDERRAQATTATQSTAAAAPAPAPAPASALAPAPAPAPAPTPAPAPAPRFTSRYSQVECVVCLEEYVAGDRIMGLPCGHEFHEACITPWLTTRRRTCPICKSDVVKAAAGDAA